MLRNDRFDCPCTPEMEGLGIAINAPIEVTFSTQQTLDPDDCRFFVCGASEFVYDTLGYGRNFADNVTFVAIDQTSQVARSGVMQPNVPNPVPPPDNLSKSTTDHSKTTIGEVFRANMAEIMTLPAVETDYVVYAVLGPYRSNSLTVKGSESSRGHGDGRLQARVRNAQSGGAAAPICRLRSDAVRDPLASNLPRHRRPLHVGRGRCVP